MDTEKCEHHQGGKTVSDRKKTKRNVAIVVALFLALWSGAVGYSNGHLTAQVSEHSQVSVDLVPIVHKVLGDNTALRAMADALMETVEVRNGTITGLEKTVRWQKDMIDDLGHIIEDWENQPPEIVEVEVPGPERIVEVPVEVIVEVPGQVVYVEIPVEELVFCPGDSRCPTILFPEEWDDSGKEDDGERKPEPEPEPEPDPDCDKDKHGGKHDRKKGKHDGNKHPRKHR